MTKIHAIRQELNEPFRDVVKGFAVMHYSRKATAEILGISKSYFTDLCSRFDLHRHFVRADYLQICKPPGHPKGKRINQPKRYTDCELLEILAKYPATISPKEFDLKQRKPCADTYVRRFGTWTKAKRLSRR